MCLEPNKSNSAQPQQIVIPTSGGGTQMIVNGALNGAVQPFVMQQVMQIQDPNTGQIQTGTVFFCHNFQSIKNSNGTYKD